MWDCYLRSYLCSYIGYFLSLLFDLPVLQLPLRLHLGGFYHHCNFFLIVLRGSLLKTKRRMLLLSFCLCRWNSGIWTSLVHLLSGNEMVISNKEVVTFFKCFSKFFSPTTTWLSVLLNNQKQIISVLQKE